MPGQPIHHRGQMKRRLAHPAGKRGAVQVHARAGVDLRLTVQRKMIAVLGNEHLGQRPLGRQSAGDEVRRRGGLDHAGLAGAAGVLRAHRDDDPQLRRHDVQPLGAVLADAHHVPAPAGTLRAVRFDDVFDPFQAPGQMPEVASRCTALGGETGLLRCPAQPRLPRPRPPRLPGPRTPVGDRQAGASRTSLS